MKNKTIFWTTTVATLVSFGCNLNLMIAPNPIRPWNMIVSAAAFLLCCIGLAMLQKDSQKPKRTFVLLLAVLAVLLISTFLVYFTKGNRPELVYGFIPVAFLATCPFVGIGGIVSLTGIPEVILPISPYIIFLLITVASYCRQKSRKKSETNLTKL